MPPKPDLASNTLTHFLDRFVYRNPKATTKSRGASTMQPMVGDDTSGLLVSTLSKSRNKFPVNSEAFLGQDVGKVAPDEVFFHKYFNTIGKGKEKARKKKEKKRSRTAEGSDAEEDEDEIWQALVRSQPELEEDSDAEMDSDIPEAIDDSDMHSIDLEEDAAVVDDYSEAEEGLDFGEDDDALVASDDDVPEGLDEVFEEEAGINGKLGNQDRDTKGRRAKRRKLKNLPTFASADDYSKMLADDE